MEGLNNRSILFLNHCQIFFEIKLSGADKSMRMHYKGYRISSCSQVCKDFSAEVQSPTNREKQEEYVWV